MTLAEVRDWIGTLGIAQDNCVYMGKLDAKKQKSIGVYPSKHAHAYHRALGGKGNASYGSKYVTLLVHWNKSPRDTESAAMGLFEKLEAVKNAGTSNGKIKFIRPLTDSPVDVGTDESGIFEMVIETEFIYERKGE